MSVLKDSLQVGTRVSCSLPYAGKGIIFNVTGEQMPSNVRQLFGGAGVTGGHHASFDIVFLNGTVSRNVSEGIVRGSSQWKILEGLESSEAITTALAFAESEKVKREAEARRKAEEFALEVQRLQVASEFAHLVQGDDLYSGVLAAKNLRLILKRAFPEVKFSVRKKGFGCVTIEWLDGPTEADVEVAASNFKGGHYCPIEDYHSHVTTPWGKVFGMADYISVRREYSSGLIECAITAVATSLASNLAEGKIDRPTAEQFKNGHLCSVHVPHQNDNLQQIIRHTLNRTRG
ncbi:hypothetical protein P2W50_31095 [Pseudomonas protegens]|uniref:LPD29 domain-containing protein n=1 Tax=Pseudomonas protegens TaxID=380021 RepID=UPI0023ECA273|nr:LPD29 domain-containing protein [Pseudomonas protegens]MDF4211099.1 hypothetical protein [Pseudomonas protegens]